MSIAVIYYVVIKIISTLLSKVEKGMRKVIRDDKGYRFKAFWRFGKVKEIDQHIKQGEKVVVIGPSGSR